MNWILSFLGKSDQLVIGQHLLLSPASAVVKPAYIPNLIIVQIRFRRGVGVLSDASQVDVILGLWKNIGFTKKKKKCLLQ